MGRKGRKARDATKNTSNLQKREQKEIMSLVVQLLELCSNPTSTVEWQEYMSIYSIVEKIRHIQKGHNFETVNRQENIDMFVSWLSENGVDTSKVTIKNCGDIGFGLMAAQDIAQSEVFLQVPRKLMMTADTAKLSSLGEMMKTDAIMKAMPNVVLALHVLNERCKSESFWSPYLNTLPETFTTPLYFSPDEIKMLKGSPAQMDILCQYKNIARQYAYFYKVFQSSPIADGPVKDHFTYDNYRWSVSVVMTRQNQIPSIEEGKDMVAALIPYWDMCNYTNGQITTDFDVEQDCSLCYSLKDYNDGDQIYIFYGARSNSQLLLHSGFVYPENEFDNVEIKLGISQKDPLYKMKSDILTKAGVIVNGTYLLNVLEPYIDLDLLTFLRVFSMSEEQLGDEEKLSAIQEAPSSTTQDIDVKVWSFLETRSSLLLRCYPNTAQEDEQELKSNDKLSDHARLIILLRLSEKKILQKVGDYAAKMKICLEQICSQGSAT